MRKPRLFWLFFILLAGSAYGQQAYTIRGEIKDSSGLALQGVTIKIVFEKDSAVTLTDKAGLYTFSKIATTGFQLTATSSGLETFSQTYEINSSGIVFRVPVIQLLPASKEMEGIVIRSVRPVLIKEDTVQFDAGAYKVREGAAVEEVIKKLPGVTVDKDGNIETQGKKVARVRVNGKDFFGGDVLTATQNIPADIIQNIQIIDDYGDAATINGVKTGEPEKIININTQPNKNKGSFGNATVAAGNEGRYAGNLFINKFDGERQVSVLGAINNTNANLFNFNGGGRGGGARGANMGNESRGGPGGAGITLSKSGGLNFRDKWGTKVSVYGSYSFSSRSTNIISSSFSQDINPENIRKTQRESVSRNNSENHRATLNVEYHIDSLNYVKASPYLSYSNSNNTSNSRSQITNARFFTLNNNRTLSESHSTGAGGNFLFNHRFRRRGRNFSANVNLDFSDNNSDRNTNGTYYRIDSSRSVVRLNDTMQIQRIGTLSRNTRTNARFSYMEPLNASGTTVLELNYDWNNSFTQSMRDLIDFADLADKTGRYNERQSNHFEYRFITNRAGVSLRGRSEKYNYSVGFQSQPSSLTGRSIGKVSATSYQNVNWVPSMRFVYHFSRNNSLTASLDGVAREPGFMQLQPVADSSNLNNIVVGNPNLVNEFTNNFSLRYNKFDSKTGNSLFVNFSYDRTDDKIVSSIFNDTTGTGRTTTYVNTDGFYGYNTNASFTRPFNNRKFVPSVSFAANYDNNISFLRGRKNTGSNWNLRPGASFRFDLDDKVDLTLRSDYTFYQTTTHFGSDSSSTIKAKTLNYGINGKNFFGDLTIGYDFSKVINYRFNTSVNSNPTILNVFAEYRFLKAKMMTIRFQAFDLFNQNVGIVRTINSNTITDSRTNRLGRYFLLSANVRLAKFSGGGNRARGTRNFGHD